VFLIVLAALMAAYGTAYVASPDVRFVARAGLEEIAILRGRRPIAEVIADPRTPEPTRQLLHLVLEVRDEAARLGLDAGETYRQYTDVGRDTLLLVLSAARKDCLCTHTWKYPVVGRIPYKGFFDPRMAYAERDRLAAKGMDTYLRPAGAFSTLGWFEDPLLSTAMSRDSVELAALVFHEIAHNSLYVASATPFNESFAQLVGYRAAEAYFAARGDSVLARRAADRWHDELVLGAYYASLAGRLERFYATKPDSAALEAGRAEAGAWAREQLLGPVGAQLRTYRIDRLAERPVNNAQLVAARIYRTHLDWFDRWFDAQGRDVARAVAGLKALVAGATGDEAFGRLEAAVGAGGG